MLGGRGGVEPANTLRRHVLAGLDVGSKRGHEATYTEHASIMSAAARGMSALGVIAAQADGIHAEAFAGGLLLAIVKPVAAVRTAPGASDFGPVHSVT